MAFVSRTFTLGAIADSTINLNGSGFGIVKMSSQYSVGHYLEFTNVQLEEGSIATPFEQRPYGLELSLCQRYYEVGHTKIYSSTGGLMAVTTLFNVRKRTSPTLIFTNSPQGVNVPPTTLEWVNSEGWVGNRTTEINCGFTASAEL